MMFYVVVSLLALGDLVYWWWADRRLRPLESSKPWRWLLGLLVGSQFAVMAWWVIFPITLRKLGGGFWIPVSTWIYVWHLFVLPATLVFLLTGCTCAGLFRGIRRLVGSTVGARRRLQPEPMPRLVHAGRQTDDLPDEDSPPDDHTLQCVTGPTIVYPSRRQFLGAATAFVPQVALAGTLAVSYHQIGQFRIRPLTVVVPTLPAALDGLTIAHLSDTHAGRFVRRKQLARVVEATAALKPDLIAFTGDLIDFNLSDLPIAIDAMKDASAIAPLFLCVGNHDLFDDGQEFRRRVRKAGLRLLVNERQRIEVRGTAIDFLGLDWGTTVSPRSHMIEQHMDRVLLRRSADRFEILVAHHPHAFDPAAAAGIPLTLAGHTHGGQLMLTQSVGAGNVFKYWSGLYGQGQSRLVVSNGVGNWFPLRINAPAEIVHITLRCG